jgi:hypothetical protein
MKCFLINPYTKTITEEDLVGDYTAIYTMLSVPEHKVSTFAIVNISETEILYVDDNGLLRDLSENRFFLMAGYPQPLAGCGLVIGGNDEGETVASQMTLEQVVKSVTFGDPFVLDKMAKKILNEEYV